MVRFNDLTISTPLLQNKGKRLENLSNTHYCSIFPKNIAKVGSLMHNLVKVTMTCVYLNNILIIYWCTDKNGKKKITLCHLTKSSQQELQTSSVYLQSATGNYQYSFN
jgi:protein-S-isoprenylcysteine O-methyltransferase Ste14